jgi:hypothetical protein
MSSFEAYIQLPSKPFQIDFLYFVITSLWIAPRFNQPFMHDFQFRIFLMKINKCDRTGILSNKNMIYFM